MQKMLSLFAILFSVSACCDCATQATEVMSESTQTIPVEKPIAENAYLIYFDWDKAVLNDEGLKKLRSVTKDLLLRKDPYHLNLNGHADTSGSPEYNMELSEKRASTIKTLLASFGINETMMSVFAFGETDLAVPTADNVREPLNRRVEIFVE